ncbi:MAG: geranylgeranylglyceryl/heptaprenylglyceryl phosphate synthase [Thermoplasmata archaeon]
MADTLAHHRMHMTLIDPEKQSPEGSADIARKAGKLGTDAIMVGGSTGVTQENLDSAVDHIKKAVRLPVIYFPSGANAIAQRCDAIYFMSMLNSKNVKNITGEHSRGAPMIRKLGIETVSMGYVIVAPGMKVGEVGEADPVQRDDIARAVGYALTAEMFGMDLFYLEAGSGAPAPVPPEMVKAVRDSVKMPILVGGGLTEPSHIPPLVAAGADIFVTGTLVENGGFESKLKKIVNAVHRA